MMGDEYVGKCPAALAQAVLLEAGEQLVDELAGTAPLRASSGVLRRRSPSPTSA
jgi:hypothetical protein